MLYSIIICVYAIIVPLLCLASFRWGVKFGLDKENAASEPIIPKLKKKPKETEEMKRMRRLENAIADYNGDE